MKTLFSMDIIKRTIFVCMIGCTTSLILDSCNENTAINNRQGQNSYTFYPDGKLRSITLSYTTHKDTFYLTNDGILKNWGKLFKIVFRDSISIEKQLRVLLEAQTFSGVLLNLQIYILTPSQHIIWDSAVVIPPPQGHGIEVFPLKKKVLIPGEYRCNVLYSYIDSATKKVLYTDSAATQITVLEKNNTSK